ncbi:MAG: hypothetical protein AB7K68_08380 [Bacteriovoracia bacterium]
MPFSAPRKAKSLSLILLSCALCPAADAARPILTPRKAAPLLIYDIGLELWGAGGARSLAKTPVNPDNLVARIPETALTAEARPDVRLRVKKARVTARPRLIYTQNNTKSGAAKTTKNVGRIQWSEAYASLDISDTLALAYGLQNYQWGPSESASPSNRIFRDTVEAKDVLYVVKGKHLVRVNFTPRPGWSEVALFEVSTNGSPEYEAQEKFAQKALLKSEYSWGGGADYAGIVTGWRNHDGLWIGEYFNSDVYEGLSLFFDISHQMGSLAYYPVDNSGVTVLSQAHKSDKKIYTFATFGGHYAFVNGIDLRFEGIFQEAGYSKKQVQSVWNALASNVPQQQVFFAMNSALAYQNGLEFPGQKYLFSSVRYPNFLNVRNWTLYARGLLSLQDSSSSAFLSSENAVGQRGTIFASVAAFSGKMDSELRGLVAYAGILGYRHAW